MKFRPTVAIVFALSAALLADAAPTKKCNPSSPPLTIATATDGGISFSPSPVPKTQRRWLRLCCTVFVDSVSVCGGNDRSTVDSLRLNSPGAKPDGTPTFILPFTANSFTQVPLADSGGVSLPGTSQKLSWPLVVLLSVIFVVTYVSRTYLKKIRKKPHKH